ncbi:AEC family transporter [Pseudooceanicola nanhaiensis]|uniref:AEC family transporter n=1 Tax=Pseudooceanicola nanhaiensis TaxID=375761 RepID=UPI001CD304E1|nr:AEC family transporter [Pseudooceanicola nanhaiensis]MCA0920416.1 AEC family transporter [Pseudooceanicola nanhaiensis]
MLLITIWPLFALICVGYLLRRRGFPSVEFWSAAERLNYFILFPALLLASLGNAPVRDPALLRFGGAAAATILIACALLALLRLVRPMPAARFGPHLQGLVRFNTYLALALLALLSGPEGVSRAAIYLAVAVPLVNVLSILALSGEGAARKPLHLAKTILRNPLILACLTGFALALSGIGLPFGTGSFLKLLGQGSLPLGLLCVGAALNITALRHRLSGLVGISLARLLAMPVLAALVCLPFGLSGVEAMVLVVFSAVPTAPTAYVLTQQLKGDGELMAGIVTFQTMAALATLPLVLWLLPIG